MVVVEEVFLTSTLAQLISSKYQVFADGIRLSFYRLGAVVALSASPLIFERMNIVTIVHVCIAIVCFVLLIMRRETFSNPTILVT